MHIWFIHSISGTVAVAAAAPVFLSESGARHAVALFGRWSPSVPLAPGDVAVLRSFALTVLTSGVYQLAAAALRWDPLFFALWASAQLAIAPLLLLLSTVLFPFCASAPLVSAVAISNGLVAVATLLALRGTLKPMSSSPAVRTAWPQAIHGLYNVLLFVVMLFLPDVVVASSAGDSPTTANSNLLTRSLGVSLLLMATLYGASSRRAAELVPFRWLSVFTRLSAQALLFALFLCGSLGLQPALGCLGDSFFALLLVAEKLLLKKEKQL